MGFGNDDKIKWIDFFLVAPHEKMFTKKNGKEEGEEEKRDPMVGHRLFNPFDSEGVDDVAHLVKIISTKCADGGKVGNLRIASHGGPSADGKRYGFFIGRNPISTKYLSKYSVDLKKLSQYFVVGTTEVVIDACSVGKDPALLIALSALWNGVAVTAFTGLQSVNYLKPAGEGPHITCTLGNRCTAGIGKY